MRWLELGDQTLKKIYKCQLDRLRILKIMCILTCLTWLIHTLFLPSKWNLYLKWLFLVYILLTNFEENHKFSNKNNHLPAWRKIGNIFSRPLFTINFRSNGIFAQRFHFEGKNDVWKNRIPIVLRRQFYASAT